MRKADVARHTVVVQTLQVHKVLEHLLIAPVCVRSNPQPLQNAAILSVMIASTQCPLSPADTPAHSSTSTFAAFPASLAAACHLAVLQLEIEDGFCYFLTVSRQEPAEPVCLGLSVPYPGGDAQ